LTGCAALALGEDIYYEAPEQGHILNGILHGYAGGILTKHHIQDVVLTVFYPPMLPDVVTKQFMFGRQQADIVGHIPHAFPIDRSESFDSGNAANGRQFCCKLRGNLVFHWKI
jgi:hypothetical protein